MKTTLKVGSPAELMDYAKAPPEYIYLYLFDGNPDQKESAPANQVVKIKGLILWSLILQAPDSIHPRMGKEQGISSTAAMNRWSRRGRVSKRQGKRRGRQTAGPASISL